MTKNQMFRRLSRKGLQAPDKIKHVALSEESIMTLLKLSEIGPDETDKLIEGITETNFDSIKLMLYEKRENYTKCL